MGLENVLETGIEGVDGITGDEEVITNYREIEGCWRRIHDDR